MDCGPACLQMIARYFGKDLSSFHMKNIARIIQKGSSLLDLVDAAKQIGIYSKGMEVTIETLDSLALPVILHWDKRHFVVLYKIRNTTYIIADPAIGILKLNKSEFIKHWRHSETSPNDTGTLLMLSAKPYH